MFVARALFTPPAAADADRAFFTGLTSIDTSFATACCNFLGFFEALKSVGAITL